MQKITIPAGTLVILSGLPGAGKSRLRSLANNLPQGAWVSSDELREQILGTFEDLDGEGVIRRRRRESANNTVFSIMREIVTARLAEKLTTVVDATNLTDAVRSEWADIAARFGVRVFVLIVGTSLEQCLANNAAREFQTPESSIREMHTPSPPVIPEEVRQRARSGKAPAVTAAQGFMLESKYEHALIDSNTTLEFTPRELEHTRYDVIGDVHGLLQDLLALLEKAGWQYAEGQLSHPQGRKLLFLGDLVDRGPDSLALVELVMRAVADGVALAIQGNHEAKLIRFYERARTEGIERWTSYSNAETGMKLLKLPPERAQAIVSFLRALPPYYVHQDSRVAFVHGDIHRFDPMTTPADAMVYGEGGFHAVDSDAEYEKRFAAGLNEYVMFRGHVPQRSVQPHIFSLERQPFQQGELVLMRLDSFLQAAREGQGTVKAFDAAVLTQRCNFDYDAYAAKAYALPKGMESLVTRKLATRQFDESKLLRVYKYSKATFWNNSWGESPWLTKARGIVLDVAGNIVSHPFDKVFNMGENGTGSDMADSTPVVEVEKLNGFLGIVSAHPLKRGELIAHTQGGFDGPFVGYIRDYLHEPRTRGLVSRFLSHTPVTLMFEVLHPEDPHIIEYTPEQMGLYLIGIRGLRLEDNPWTEEAVDAAALEMGIRRPSWRRTTFGQVRQFVLSARTEGVMVRLDDPEQQTVLKWKTPYYLTTKFLGRLSSKKIAHLYGNPQNFKQTIDEEFYPLVDALVARCDAPTLAQMPDAERVALVRSLIDGMY